MKHDKMRRRVLKGMLGGTMVSVALPFLDCFLNGNGTALAATGAPLPIRFGTWHWGCGANLERWVPKTTGAKYDLPVELKPIEAYRDEISVLSGFNVMLDGRTNFVHWTGLAGIRTGSTPAREKQVDAPSIDVLIAAAIGEGTRFRSIEVASTGNPSHSYSMLSANAVNPSEASPAALYQRLFGAEFRDPNKSDFKPDPRVMVRKSVLSAVQEERDSFMKQVGAADRERLDQYFSAVRQLEKGVEQQLQKPAPAASCSVPPQLQEAVADTDIEHVMANHRLFSQLIAMALACNQTKVFNVVFSDSASSLRRAGISSTHHILTHEELIDPKLGYQPQASWFIDRSMEAWASFVHTLASIREGDGSLLDNSLVFAHSDTQYARVHSIDGIPIMIAGRAGGRIRSGLHINGNGESVSRVGLTLQQAMGLPVDAWGTNSMRTSKPISELFA